MAIPVNGQVGPVVATDGTQTLLRQGRDSEVATADAIPRFSEATRRRLTFSGMTLVAGTTIVAANVTPVAAAAASMISLWNPPGSGKDLHLVRCNINGISGTPGVGQWVYNVAYNQAVTAIQNNQGVAGLGPVCTYASGVTGVGKIFTQTALTGATVQALFKPCGFSFFGGPIAATTNVNYVDPIDGAIVLGPGGLLSLAAPLIGTTFVVAGGFDWMEIGAQP